MYIGPKEAVGSGHPMSHNISYSWPHTSLNITGGVLPGAVGQLSVSTCDLVVSMISLVNNGVQIKVIIPWIGRHIVTWLLIRIVHSGYYTLSSH